MEKLPSKLYKYQSFNANSISNLINRQIFFSSAKNFNDPYDCALEFPITDLTKEEYEKLFQEMVSEYAKDHSLKIESEKANHAIPKEFESKIRSKISEIVSDLRQNHFSNRGIACFSATKDDILMWGYYANGHRGFCLEFDTKYAPIKRALEVQYEKEILPYKISTLFWGGPKEEIFAPMLTKYFGWKHEKEYRAIDKEVNQLLEYSSEALTGIYLGSEISQNNLNTIKSIVKAEYNHVKIYQGRREKEEFKINFDPLPID